MTHCKLAVLSLLALLCRPSLGLASSISISEVLENSRAQEPEFPAHEEEAQASEIVPSLALSHKRPRLEADRLLQSSLEASDDSYANNVWIGEVNRTLSLIDAESQDEVDALDSISQATDSEEESDDPTSYLSGSFSLKTDYLFRGVSQTNNSLSLQGRLQYNNEVTEDLHLYGGFFA